MTDTPMIAVVDDHLLLVETMQAALRTVGHQVISLPPSLGDRLLPSLLGARPHLVLLDLDLGPFGDSTRLVAPLVDAGIRVLVVTGLTDLRRIALALEQGAIGYQSKAEGFEALIEAAARAVTASGRLDPARTGALLRELHEFRVDELRRLAPFQSLTGRERDVLFALCQGATVTRIAGQWTVSEATVRSHVQRVLIKLGARSQTQAVGMALRGGWLETAVERTAC